MPKPKKGAEDHGHLAVPPDVTLRVKALESLLVEKGLVDPAALEAQDWSSKRRSSHRARLG